jgi:predicted ATPase
VQYALLNLAEEAAKKQDFQTAAQLAERAYKVLGLAGTELTHLKRLYRLLSAGKSLLAPEVRKEAESYDVTLQLTSEEARTSFKQEKPTNTLPLRGTSFVGRDEELTELATLLSKPNVSLLTLLGTAGVGKTRLALQFAFDQQKLGTFQDGVYFVALEPLSDASQIPAALLTQFNLAQQGKAEALEQLVKFLAQQRVLIVLDNFEHLVEGASFLSEVLNKCPGVKFLVTSRQTLKLEEEHVFALEGLPYPQGPALARDTKSVQLSGAVQLFKDRAQQVQPQFDLEQHLPDVLRICRLVEGLPLGLELAASWVRLMSCADIAKEIENNLELLTSHATNVPERHRSLRAAFEYSWQRLSHKEQQVLRKLSVFRGGFRREAASEVAGATIPVLASLVDKSLIRVLPTGRYDCHPLLYQYAQEKLAQFPAEEQTTKAEHVRYYQGVVRQQELAIERGQQKDALRVFQEERGNIELVLEWGLQGLHLSDLLRWLDLMDSYYDSRGAYHDGLEFLERAATMLDKNNPEERAALGRVLVEKAWYLLRLGDYHEAKRVVKEGSGLLPKSSRPEWWVLAHDTQGVLLRRTGEYHNAKVHIEKSLGFARESGNEKLIAKALASLADEEDKLGNLAVSEAYFLEAIAIYQKRGMAIGAIRSLNNLGFHYYTRGDSAKAKPILEEGLRLAKEVEFTQTIPYFLNNLAYVAYDEEDYQKALELNLEALSVSKETGEKAVQAEILVALARCETALGRPRSAWGYSRQGIEISKEVGYILILLQGLFARAELYRYLGRLEEAGKLLFVILHHPAATSVEKNPAYQLLSTLQSQLTAKHLEALETLAQKLSLEQCVFDVLNDAYVQKLIPA